METFFYLLYLLRLGNTNIKSKINVFLYQKLIVFEYHKKLSYFGSGFIVYFVKELAFILIAGSSSLAENFRSI